MCACRNLNRLRQDKLLGAPMNGSVSLTPKRTVIMIVGARLCLQKGGRPVLGSPMLGFTGSCGSSTAGRLASQAAGPSRCVNQL
jgi:hypothetical protein